MNFLSYVTTKVHLLLIGILAIIYCSNLHAIDKQLSSSAETTSKEPTCADFLAKLNKKPQNLEFIGCKKINSHGLAALESSYRVKGANASKVEAYFVTSSSMPKLRRLCCGWEPFQKNRKTEQPNGFYKSDNDVYEISMVSGETLVSQRSHWKKIPYFLVTVLLYLETP